MIWQFHGLCKAKSVRKTTVLDVMRRLLQPKNRMVSTLPSKTACYISILNIIQGDVDPQDVILFVACLTWSDGSMCYRFINHYCVYAKGSWPISYLGDLPQSRWHWRVNHLMFPRAIASAAWCWQTILVLPQLVTQKLLELGYSSNLQLFKRMLDQYDRLRKRNAFLEQYKKEKMFENGYEEFDDSR